MQMVLLVFRDSLESDIQNLLQELEIVSFTQAPKVLGTGETGRAFDSFEWPGCNSMILSAMEENQAERVVERFRTFRDGLKHRQNGSKIPLRVFTFPCEWVL
jgi:hypothetical protein